MPILGPETGIFSVPLNRQSLHMIQGNMFSHSCLHQLLNGKALKKKSTVNVLRYPNKSETAQKSKNKMFLMKVSGKSHSAENPKESSMLAKHFVSCKNRASMKKIRKSEKTHLKKNSYIARWNTEKPHF